MLTPSTRYTRNTGICWARRPVWWPRHCSPTAASLCSRRSSPSRPCSTRRSSAQKNLKKAYGEWAVVTGATDGIGKAMAFEMARKGMSVCLVARSEDKLKACKDECVALHPNVQVKTLVVDFGSFGLATSKRVAAELDALEVGVLGKKRNIVRLPAVVP